MGVFQLEVTGVVTTSSGKTVIESVTGLLIAPADGPSVQQLEDIKRGIVAKLRVPASSVTFSISRDEMTREQLTMFAGHARTHEEMTAPKPRPKRPKLH